MNGDETFHWSEYPPGEAKDRYLGGAERPLEGNRGTHPWLFGWPAPVDDGPPLTVDTWTQTNQKLAWGKIWPEEPEDDWLYTVENGNYWEHCDMEASPNCPAFW